MIVVFGSINVGLTATVPRFHVRAHGSGQYTAHCVSAGEYTHEMAVRVGDEH